MLLVLLLAFGTAVGRADLAASATATAVTDLRGLAGLQADYFAQHARYAPDLETLGFSGWATIEMNASDDRWSATAEYRREGIVFGFSVHCAIAGGAPALGAADMAAAAIDQIRCEH